jgi:two-component system, NarL family, invasion response regulator UvrY
MIKILVADDHAIMREGLKRILENTVDIQVTGEASNGLEVLSEVKENDYDVVLLDISMPDLNGLDIMKQLIMEQPGMRVLILTTHSEEQYAVRAFRAGASGYLTKVSATGELVAAIRKVSLGKKYVSSSLAEELTAFLKDGLDILPHEKLSKREYQVLCMIAYSKEVREIADELCLTVKTVRTYRNRILKKMRIKNNTELTLYAIENHLVEREIHRTESESG